MDFEYLFPNMRSLIVYPKPTGRLFRSVWLGLTVPLLHLPEMLILGAIIPFIRSVMGIFTITFSCMWFGLRGKVGTIKDLKLF